MSKKAIITGITGQDGSYLAEQLIEKGYQVHGVVRRTSSLNRERIEHLLQDQSIHNKSLFLHYGDLTDSSNLGHLIQKIRPDEVFNLAAQSHVQVSFEMPEYTADVNGLGTLRLLEAIRSSGIQCKFYQASTSELYGKVVETPQTETTPFYPRSPYGVGKLYAFWITKNYREAYNLFACNGILFNHESPRRGKNFVTRKITSAVARIKKGSSETLQLGNMDSKRDWGFAPEYTEGMWKILQAKEPDDFVLATGKTSTVRNFVDAAFAAVEQKIKWEGKGLEEKAIDPDSGRVFVAVNPRYFRPTEVEILIGDPTKAKEKLGWVPKTSLEELVKIMVKADLADL